MGDEALCAARDGITAMPSTIGLYPALQKLPQRQLDVVILQYVLRYSSRKTGWYVPRYDRERLAPVSHHRSTTAQQQNEKEEDQ